MPSRSHSRHLAAVIVAALSLAACSRGGSEATSATAESSSSEVPTGSGSVATTSTTSTTSTSVATTEPVTVPPTTGPDTTAPFGDRPTDVVGLLQLDRPIVLAHTGGEDAYPGSTMFGFSESMNDGVDVLDLNVILSSDGVLMVQHDDTVDRTTNGTGAVADLTADELIALDNAYWFTPDCGVCTDQPDDAYIYRGVRTGDRPAPEGYTADDFAMPTFQALVERFPDAVLNIEIKGNGDPARAAADALANDLTDLDRADASIVTSFDDEIVAYFHGLLPDVELSPGLNATTAWVLQGAALPDGMRILQLPPEYEGVPVITPERITAASQAGYPVWVWPNNRELENRESYLGYLDMGIVGLNINFPAEGVAAVQQYLLDTGDGDERDDDGGNGDGNSGTGTTAELSDDAMRQAVDPTGESTEFEVITRGDVDGDGDLDALVRTTWCGASCGTQLDLIVNENGDASLVSSEGGQTFAPWYNGAGAAQSNLTQATIVESTIELVGNGLCGDVPVGDSDGPGSCSYDTVRTATYNYANGGVQPVSVEPAPG